MSRLPRAPTPTWLRWQAAALGALTVACVLTTTGCTSLSPEALEPIDQPVTAVAFENARGEVSAGKSAAIVQSLERSAGDSDILDKHLAVEQAINADSPLVLGNKLTLLQDGPATYAAMFAVMREARDHIHLETYIIADDEVGQQFAELLLAKQAAGVPVRLIYDSVGCLNTPRAFFDRLRAGGIQVLEFNPVNPLASNQKAWRLNNRDHRKLLVVDGRIAFIGGINISEAYSSGSSIHLTRPKATGDAGWRDTHLQIEGPVVAEFQKLFLDTWHKQKGPALATGQPFPRLEPQGINIVRAIGSAAGDPRSLIYLTLLSAIEHAEQRIYLTIAYFVPDPQLIAALTAAAQRGVDVKLILPSHTDSWAVFHAGRSHYAALLRAGVHIYERRGAVMHAKTASIDGVWSTVGSTNLDWRSFLHNDEINASVLGRDFSAQLDAMFARDLAESNAIDLKQWEHRSILLRLQEWAARLAEYWL
ncbi:MAG: cardiolipin synthase [Gammaproteobacteria bacterium]|jgi:cardiolipin synthase|nr:cardiolipin synthase [Gammaproteobacteria bacterium]MBV1731085.1 cardiolipin synthase [Hydrogenophaga sp.]